MELGCVSMALLHSWLYTKGAVTVVPLLHSALTKSSYPKRLYPNNLKQGYNLTPKTEFVIYYNILNNGLTQNKESAGFNPVKHSST